MAVIWLSCAGKCTEWKRHFWIFSNFQKLRFQWPEMAFMCEWKVKMHRKSFVYRNTHACVDKELLHKSLHAEQLAGRQLTENTQEPNRAAWIDWQSVSGYGLAKYLQGWWRRVETGEGASRVGQVPAGLTKEVRTGVMLVRWSGEKAKCGDTGNKWRTMINVLEEVGTWPDGGTRRYTVTERTFGSFVNIFVSRCSTCRVPRHLTRNQVVK